MSHKILISYILFLLISCIVCQSAESSLVTIDFPFGASADVTGLNAPTIALIAPTNGSTGQSFNPSCMIWANDTDSALLTAKWYTNKTGTWTLIKTYDGNITQGTITRYTFTNFNTANTKYYWCVAVNDSDGHLDNHTFFFTTAKNYTYTTLDFGGSADVFAYSPPTVDVIFPANNSINVSISPTCSVWANDTGGSTLILTWSNNASGSWVNYKTESVAADTINNYQFANFNGFSKKYYWRVNVSDGTNISREWYTFTTYASIPKNYTYTDLSFGGTCRVWGNAPEVETAVPANHSVDINMYPTFEVTVIEPQSQNYDITWATNSSGTWIPFAYNLTCVSGGTYKQYAGWANTSNTKYYWQVQMVDTEGHWNNETFCFTTLNYTWGEWSDAWVFHWLNFSSPSSFNAATQNDTKINLTWVKDENSSNTYIVRKIGSYPTDRNDGTNIYNNTGNYFNDTGLHQGTQYYYSAWSYNATQDIFTPSSSQTVNYTCPGDPSYLHDTASTTDSISLAWTKGTNATKTVIRYSNYTYPSSYLSNLSGYNNTASSCAIGSLSSNTTYYFRAWSYILFDGYILWSIGNSSCNATTLTSAGSPTGFTATTNNDTAITLSWTKAYGSLKTRIQKKVGSYPTSITDGTTIYNGTGTAYVDTGLSPVTHYYYRAWGWNGLEFSSGYASANNITLPSKPVNFVGSLSGTTLTITWIKGTGATRTVINQGLSSYPTSPTNGTSIYNGTGTFTTVFGVTDFYYFRGWSYAVVDGVALFSDPVDLIYGGITINVYNESKPTQKISFNLLITNNEGSQTYSKSGASSPCFIDLSDVPVGNKTIFIISNTSYKQRTYYEDIRLNTFYNFSFYLPPLTTPGGGGGGSSPEENKTTLYLLTVYNRYDQPLQDVKIAVKKYINSTGKYQDVGIIYTDAAGQANIYLIPFTLYQFTCSKEDFVTGISYWTPTNLIQTHTFILDYEIIQPPPYENPYDYITFSATFTTNTSLFISVSDSSNNLTNAIIYIYENKTLIDTYNFTSTPFLYNYTNNESRPNITRAEYTVVLYVIDHVNFGSYNFTIMISRLHFPRLLLNLDLQLTGVLGDPGAGIGAHIGWINIFICGLGIFVIVSFGRYWAGIGIAAMGLVIGLLEFAFGLPGFTGIQIVSFIAYCIIMGALVEIGKAKQGRVGY